MKKKSSCVNNRKFMSGPSGDLLAVVLIVGASLIVFAQVMDFDFVAYDDTFYVSQNPVVLEGFTMEGLRWAFGFNLSNWHPLTWLSLMFDAEIGGVDPGIYHTTNLMLHVMSALLLYWVLRRMQGQPMTSLFAALLFAIHPLHVESVAWIAERKDVLSTLFWFLTMLAYMAYGRRPGPGRYAVVALCFSAGLMAKSMLVTLPVILLALDLWPLGRRASGFPRLLLEKIPLFVMSAIVGVLTIMAQSGGGAVRSLESISLSARMSNALVTYVLYILKMIWPSGLAVLYPHRGDSLEVGLVATSAIVLIAMSWMALRSAKTRPYLTVGWLWFVVTLLPVIGVLQVGLQSRADRYTYVPLVGLFIAISWGANDLAEFLSRSNTGLFPGKRGQWVVGGAAAVVTALLMSVSYVQAGVWRDSETLFRHALDVTQDNATAHSNLANTLLDAGDVGGAVQQGREALRIDPTHLEAPVVLANALVATGQTTEAIAIFRQALRHRPQSALFMTNLGVILGQQGEFTEATRLFRSAIESQPAFFAAHFNMGILLAQQGRFTEAISELEEALRHRPFDPEALASLELARSLQAQQSR